MNENATTCHSFSVGDAVFVWWMGEVVPAKIYERHPKQQYRVEIDGVTGHPFYAVDELLAEATR